MSSKGRTTKGKALTAQEAAAIEARQRTAIAAPESSETEASKVAAKKAAIEKSTEASSTATAAAATTTTSSKPKSKLSDDALESSEIGVGQALSIPVGGTVIGISGATPAAPISSSKLDSLAEPKKADDLLDGTETGDTETGNTETGNTLEDRRSEAQLRHATIMSKHAADRTATGDKKDANDSAAVSPQTRHDRDRPVRGKFIKNARFVSTSGVVLTRKPKEASQPTSAPAVAAPVTTPAAPPAKKSPAPKAAAAQTKVATSVPAKVATSVPAKVAVTAKPVQSAAVAAKPTKKTAMNPTGRPPLPPAAAPAAGTYSTASLLAAMKTSSSVAGILDKPPSVTLVASRASKAATPAPTAATLTRAKPAAPSKANQQIIDQIHAFAAAVAENADPDNPISGFDLPGSWSIGAVNTEYLTIGKDAVLFIDNGSESVSPTVRIGAGGLVINGEDFLVDVSNQVQVAADGAMTFYSESGTIELISNAADISLQAAGAVEITAGSGDVRIESVDDDIHLIASDDIRLIASDDILLEASGAMRFVAVNSVRIESTTDDVVIESIADDVQLIAADNIFIDAVNDVVIQNTTNFAVTVSNDLIATVANDVSFHGKAVYLTADTNLSVNADSLDAYTVNSIVLDSGTEVTLTAPSVKVNGAALLAPVYGEFLATEQGTIANNDLVVLDTAGAANSTGVSSASGTITLDAVGLYEVSWRVHATRATAGLIKLALMCIAGEINGVVATVVIPMTTVGSSAAAAALVEITGRALINATDTVTASAFGIVNLSGVNIDVGAVDLWENIIVRRVDYMTV